MTKHRDQAIARIAKICGIDTLETRNSDGLDFHDIHVGTIREMMERAYAAGAEAASKKGATK